MLQLKQIAVKSGGEVLPSRTFSLFSGLLGQAFKSEEDINYFCLKLHFEAAQRALSKALEDDMLMAPKDISSIPGFLEVMTPYIQTEFSLLKSSGVDITTVYYPGGGFHLIPGNYKEFVIFDPFPTNDIQNAIYIYRSLKNFLENAKIEAKKISESLAHIHFDIHLEEVLQNYLTAVSAYKLPITEVSIIPFYENAQTLFKNLNTMENQLQHIISVSFQNPEFPQPQKLIYCPLTEGNEENELSPIRGKKVSVILLCRPTWRTNTARLLLLLEEKGMLIHASPERSQVFSEIMYHLQKIRPNLVKIVPVKESGGKMIIFYNNDPQVTTIVSSYLARFSINTNS